MSDIGELARGMAATAMAAGSGIAFDTAVAFCEKLSQAYAAQGNQAATTAAQECANGIKGLKEQIEQKRLAGDSQP